MSQGWTATRVCLDSVNNSFPSPVTGLPTTWWSTAGLLCVYKVWGNPQVLGNFVRFWFGPSWWVWRGTLPMTPPVMSCLRLYWWTWSRNSPWRKHSLMNWQGMYVGINWIACVRKCIMMILSCRGLLSLFVDRGSELGTDEFFSPLLRTLSTRYVCACSGEGHIVLTCIRLTSSCITWPSSCITWPSSCITWPSSCITWPSSCRYSKAFDEAVGVFLSAAGSDQKSIFYLLSSALPGMQHQVNRCHFICMYVVYKYVSGWSYIAFNCGCVPVDELAICSLWVCPAVTA